MVATRRLKVLTASVIGRLDFPPGPVAVALSGGADSAALLHLAKGQCPHLRAIHIHHARPASDRLEGAAVAIADAVGVTLEIGRVEVDPWSEGGGRIARYRALEDHLVAGEWLLTGHTADDQAETVLAQLMRGAGAVGMSGIARRRPPIARPILGLTRSETRELATLAGLHFLDDPDNEDPTSFRNRIRRELIPYLETSFSPELSERLVNTSASYSEPAPAPGPAIRTSEAVRLPIGVLWAGGKDAAARWIRSELRDLHGGYPLDRAEVERVWAVVVGEARAAQLPGGVRVDRDGPWLRVEAVQPTTTAPAEWRVPGEVTWGRWNFLGTVTDVRPEALPLGGWHAVLDLDKTGESLTITHGSRGPVVVGRSGPVWEPGEGTLAAGWVETGTRRYLCAQCVEKTGE
ncbi:MAG: tRNA lysidine(34) synthetase TilS [Actinomycetota bacterium]